MVTLTGAHQAQPIATEIDKLQLVFNQLDAAANNTTVVLWKFDLNVYLNSISSEILLTDNFSTADSQAILFSIRNIIGTKISVLTNQLGAIA